MKFLLLTCPKCSLSFQLDDRVYRNRLVEETKDYCPACMRESMAAERIKPKTNISHSVRNKNKEKV